MSESKEKILRYLLLDKIKSKTIKELMEIVGFTCFDCKNLIHYDVSDWGCKKKYCVDRCFQRACIDIDFRECIKNE